MSRPPHSDSWPARSDDSEFPGTSAEPRKRSGQNARRGCPPAASIPPHTGAPFPHRQYARSPDCLAAAFDLENARDGAASAHWQRARKLFPWAGPHASGAQKLHRAPPRPGTGPPYACQDSACMLVLFGSKVAARLQNFSPPGNPLLGTMLEGRRKVNPPQTLFGRKCPQIFSRIPQSRGPTAR